jgi:hypothetical protein
MKEKNQLVSVVFVQLYYSHSEPETGSGSEGCTTTILGIATTPEIAHQMIVVDHLETVKNEGLNVLKYPLLPSTIVDKHDNVIEGFGVTISGSEGGTSWTNKVSWYAVNIETDTLLDNFEL